LIDGKPGPASLLQATLALFRETIRALHGCGYRGWSRWPPCSINYGFANSSAFTKRTLHLPPGVNEQYWTLEKKKPT
jgi:hypothetical protein